MLMQFIIFFLQLTLRGTWILKLSPSLQQKCLHSANTARPPWIRVKKYARRSVEVVSEKFKSAVARTSWAFGEEPAHSSSLLSSSSLSVARPTLNYGDVMSADVMLHTPPSTIHHKHTPNLQKNAPVPLGPPAFCIL